MELFHPQWDTIYIKIHLARALGGAGRIDPNSFSLLRYKHKYVDFKDIGKKRITSSNYHEFR